MTIFRECVVQIEKLHDHGVPHDSMIIRMNPVTKTVFEQEMRTRPSFDHAKGRDLHITNFFEVDRKGFPVPGGWKIPIEVSDGVPIGQIYVGVIEYAKMEGGLAGVQGAITGREVRPRVFFPGRN